MTNPNDISTGSAAGLTQFDDSLAQASKPSTPFPTSSRASAQKSGGGIGAAATDDPDAAHDAVDQASQAGDAFVKRLVDGAHAAIDRLADAAGPAFDRFASAFANPSGKLSDIAGQASDKKDEWVGGARDIIRENPFAAIATALAVGAIYVKLTSARRRDRLDLDE